MASARVDVPGVLTLDHTMLMIEVAVDGAGIACVLETAVLPWLNDGRLVALLDSSLVCVSITRVIAMYRRPFAHSLRC
ncbi:LysR substrate-binding domain-containing protein [Herbaspirillum sp. RV1423]|uniref:LysR substrate-binding domain-containing protein n=1 Tax=Herbaspirillum sp. RV1423 TaxID=1443993 RepID=UPI0009DE3BF0